MIELEIDDIHLCPICDNAVRREEEINIVWNGAFAMLAHRDCAATETARPAKPQGTEWVDGLPPVGWEGEYTKPSGFIGKTCVWRWCVVVAHDCGGALIRTDKGRYHLLAVPEYEFRSTATQAEREREETVWPAYDYLAENYNFETEPVLNLVYGLYDAGLLRKAERAQAEKDRFELARDLLDDLSALDINVSGKTATALAISFMNRGWRKGDS